MPLPQRIDRQQDIVAAEEARGAVGRQLAVADFELRRFGDVRGFGRHGGGRRVLLFGGCFQAEGFQFIDDGNQPVFPAHPSEDQLAFRLAALPLSFGQAPAQKRQAFRLAFHLLTQPLAMLGRGFG